MSLKTTPIQVLSPYGTWSSLVQYQAEVVYGGVANTPLYVACPVVKSTDGIQYYATGYNKTTGLPAQPVLGVTPQSAPNIWEPLTAGDGSGSVTSLSVVSANGLAGTVANPTTTPAITLSTSVTGILQGNGTAISAALTSGSGTKIPLTDGLINWTPTFTCVVPGDLNVTYNQQAGSVQVIGRIAFVSFYLAASFTQTTASGTISIAGFASTGINFSDEADGVMDYILHCSGLHTAGYTSYQSYTDGLPLIHIAACTTDPSLNGGANKLVSIGDIDSGSTFKFRGMLIVPVA